MAEPIYPNRPAAQQRLANKYSGGGPLSSFLDQLTPTTRTALTALDTERANMGRNPLTSTQTLLAATAAERGAPVTPEPDAPWWVDAARDVQAIAGAIPKMPALLASEARAVGTLPDAIEEMQAGEHNIASWANLPGVRLLPGSFVAGAFAPDRGGVGELTDHPVMSLLDVLPFASKAAKSSATVRTATELAEQARPITAQFGTPTRTPAVSTFIRNWQPGGPRTTTARILNQDVEVMQPNIVGQSLSRLRDNLASNNPVGRWATDAFGRDARALSRSFNRISSDAALGNLDDLAGADPVVTREAFRVADQARALREEFADIGQPRQAEIKSILESGDTQARAAFSPREADYVARVNALNDDIAQRLVDEGDLARIDGEIYDVDTATKIRKRRHAEDTQLAAWKLRRTLDDADQFAAPPAELLADLRAALADPAINGARKKVLARGYIAALDNAGFDIAKLHQTAMRTKPGQMATLLSRIPDDVAGLARASRAYDPTVAQTAITQLRSLRGTDPIARDLWQALRRDDISAARSALSSLSRRKKFTPPVDVDALALELSRRRNLSQAQGALAKYGFSDKALRKAAKGRAGFEARSVPARFQEPVRAQADATLRAEASRSLAGDDLTRAFDLIDQRAYDMLGSEFGFDIGRIKAEAAQSWQMLRAQGIDPVFVHHVAPNRYFALQSSRVLDYTPTLGQTKARLWDTGATVNDIAMAVEARGLEILIQQGSRAFVEDVLAKWARTGDEVHAMYADAARQAYDANPSISVEAHLQNLVRKDWSVFDPNTFLNPGQPRAGVAPQNVSYVPRTIGSNLEKLRPKPSELGKLVDPVMGVFRTSLLPLASRWHLYNIVGGAVMVMSRAENPLTVWKYMRQARELTGSFTDVVVRGKRGMGVEGLADDVSLTAAERAAARLAPPGGAFRQATEWMTELGRTKNPAQRAVRLQQVRGGATLRKLFDQANDKSRLLRDPFNKFVQKSYDANQWFDDFYRAMAYLEGHDKALTRGLSRAESIAKGIDAARSILQNWDTITPMERSAMRFLFPFYSWTRHLLRFVLAYPADHPWRMSILTNFAEAEMTDANLGLPQRLRDLLFPFGIDDEGNTTAINVGGMNPFRDVASWFTLGGFLAGDGDISTLTSQANPFISTVLQFAGVDPSTGAGDLYPTLVYDPTTGGMKVAPQGGVLQTTLGNFLPQSKALMNLVGMNREFSDLMRRNPSAAGRMLTSGVGLPVLAREVNVPQEVMKAELTRFEAMRDTISAGQKSGDYDSIAAAYPMLAPFARRLEALSRTQEGEELRARSGVPGNMDPSVFDTMKAALRSTVPANVG